VRKKLVRKNVLECKQLQSNNDMLTKKKKIKMSLDPREREKEGALV